jgi:hypothetical protein
MLGDNIPLQYYEQIVKDFELNSDGEVKFLWYLD